MLFLRSLLFALILLVVTPIWACVCFLAAPLPYNQRYYVTARWNVFVIWLAKVLCGIRYQIKGMENLPDAPVIPIALNSGDCWPKNSFVKKPGLITVSIGQPISPNGQSPDEMMRRVEDWIESEMRVISPNAYRNESGSTAGNPADKPAGAS